MARPGGAVAVVAIVVIIAGCTAADTPSPAPTVSPAPVPDVTRTATGDLAPGVTEAGIRWPHVLIRAHVGTLQGESFTVESVRTVNSSRREGRSRTVMRGEFAANKSRYHQTFIERRDGQTEIHSELFADGEQLYEAVGTGADRRYYRPRSKLRSPPRPESFFGNPTQDDTIYIGVKAMETSLDAVTTDGPDQRYRLTGSEVRLPGLLAVGTLGTYADRVTESSVTVTVGPEGVVYGYRLRYSAVRRNETVQVTRTITFSDVGSTTVPAPSWYPFARQQFDDEGNATSL